MNPTDDSTAAPKGHLSEQATRRGFATPDFPIAPGRHDPPFAGQHPQSSPSPSTWVWVRFQRNRLAVLALYVLAALVGVALLAEFFAPYSQSRRNLDFIYAPPQLPSFNMSDGFVVPVLKRELDPVTLKSTYRQVSGETVRLGFFVRGEPYKLWGLIPAERRFFGIKNPDSRLTQSESPVQGFYFLGADALGRDVLSRLIFGSRISLSLGLCSMVLVFLLGTILGGISGYLGGGWDSLIQRVIEIVNSFPQLPLWLVLAALFPATWSQIQVFFAISLLLSLLGWTDLARVVRGKILALRSEDYALAARALGVGHTRILFRHLLPGVTSHILASVSLAIPAMILGETALSFLGIGLRPPVVSWGVMLQTCMQLQSMATYPWLLMPVVPVVLTVLAFHFVGDGLRDASDPHATR